MIIRPDKRYEACSLYPDVNWYENEPENVVIDETTQEGKALAKEVKRLFPNFTLVVDNGFVIAINEILPDDPTYIPKVPDPPSVTDVLKQRVDDQDALLMDLIYGGTV